MPDDVPDLSSGSVQHFRHAIGRSGLFDDAALASLLDGYPAHDLNVTTMGQRFSDGGWRTGAVRDLRGEEILRAVRAGHLWLNVKYLHRNRPEYARLMDDVYAEISGRRRSEMPAWRTATLLISSPNAFVHYHADSVPNILWHLRGRKRIFVYPADDERFAPSAWMERICAGDQDEDLPYRSEFEEAARVFELEPDWALIWPQHSPHRVENVDGLNVSLSTEHMTATHRRRVQIMRANGLLRRLRLGPRSRKPDSLVARAKVALALTHRGVQKVVRRKPIQYETPVTFHVDPDSPTGYRDVVPS